MKADLRNAMAQAGLRYAGPLQADGKLHRFKSEGDKARNSWYVLHAGPPAAGAFGCWRRGFKETWHDGKAELSQAQWDTVRRQLREAAAARERTEAELQAKARRMAGWIARRAKPADPAHVYLTAKAVAPAGQLLEYRGALVLPLRDATGTLHSLQFIGPDGTKRFLTGGRISGCYFTVADKPDGPLVICEGFATGASIAEATGCAVVAAMNCGNLLAVARELRAKWPQREIIVAADDDRNVKDNPGLTKATEAARTIGGKLAVPQFKDIDTNTDFNDLHRLEGLAVVRTQIESATEVNETDEDRFQRLAKLPPIEYDRVRKTEAESAGMRVGTLDNEVERRRPNEDIHVQGSKISFPEIEPWDSPVSGAELLNEIEAIISRFVVATRASIVAATLFVVHTFAFDLGDISPVLFITSPTKRCGKSKFFGILSRLVYRPFTASSATAAGIYRTIEMHHPTLCIDEVDAFMKGDEQLRGLINSGHTREAAFHLGCIKHGEDINPVRYSTWTPKIFSGIGKLADTIEDRAIIIQMKRRRKDEPCERLRHRNRFDDIPRKALRFISDHRDAILNADDPPVPAVLNDRAADNWTPLLVLADLAGGDWPTKARQVAVELSGDGESLGDAQLILDIRNIFAGSGVDKMSSEEMAERLGQMEGRPWAEYGDRRRPITKNQLADLLRPFKIWSKTIRGKFTKIEPDGSRVTKDTAKGYQVDFFADAFGRYIPQDGPSNRHNVTLPDTNEEGRDFQNVTSEGCDVSKSGVLASHTNVCDVVTFQEAESRGEALL
jgi:putative DNA primase/helicase